MSTRRDAVHPTRVAQVKSLTVPRDREDVDPWVLFTWWWWEYKFVMIWKKLGSSQRDFHAL